MKSRSSRPGLTREAVIGQIRVASGGGRGSPRPPVDVPGTIPNSFRETHDSARPAGRLPLSPWGPRSAPLGGRDRGHPPPGLQAPSILTAGDASGVRGTGSREAAHRSAARRMSRPQGAVAPTRGNRHVDRPWRLEPLPPRGSVFLPSPSALSRLNSSSSSILAGEVLPCTSVPRVELSVPPRRRRRPRQDLALLTWVSSSPQTSALHPGNPRPSLRSARRVSWALTAGRERLHVCSRGRVCGLQKQHRALNLILPFTQQNASKP